MFQLLRRGFGPDLALFLLVAVLTGAAVAGGLAAAIDAAFGDAVGHLLGQAGQYDVIVHLREDAAEGSLPVLKELIRRRWPDADIHEGVRVAGNANVFVGLPPSAHEAEVFESLPSLFSQVTGYNGHTWLVEPSLTVSGVRPGVVEVLKPQLQNLEGVRFSFRHGSHLTVVLEDAAYAQQVGQAVDQLLRRYQVVEIHLPEEAPAAPSPRDLWEALPEHRRQAWVDLTAAGGAGGDLETLVEQLGGVLEFLVSRVYASAEAGLKPGDRIVLQGSAPTPPEPGLYVEDLQAAGFVVVEISGLEQGRPFGRIVQGDASELVPVGAGRYAEIGYRWEPAADHSGAGRVGGSVGTVSVESPRYALQATLEQAGAVVEQVARLTHEVEEAAGITVDTLSQWVQAALNVSSTQQTVAQAQSLLNGSQNGDGSQGGGVQGVDRQALISLLISLLAQNNGLGQVAGNVLGGLDGTAGLVQNGYPAGESPGSGGPGASPGGSTPGGLAGLQQQLERLKQQVGHLDTEAFQELTASTARAREALPQLRDDMLSERLAWLDGYRRQRPGWNRALELLVPAGDDLEALGREVERVTSASPLITTFEAGLLNPNPRTLLFQVLTQVRQTLAGMIAVGLVALILWADGSTLLHGAEQLARLPHRRTGEDRPSRRRGGREAGGHRWPSVLWGALWGCTLLMGIFFLSGAQIPGLAWHHVVILGALMGAVTGGWARRLSPISADEVVAAAALGLSPDAVMREIIIPEGRPGFLMLINRWRMRMK